MAFYRSVVAAAAALSLATLTTATNYELPPCTDKFTPFTSKGCYTNGDTALIMRSKVDGNDMTVEKCTAVCKGNAFRYAGLTYYGVCYCGDEIAADKTTDTSCNYPCNGNKGQLCGGKGTLNIWEDPTYTKTPSEVAVADYAYSGCYVDNVNNQGRAFPWPESIEPAKFTPETCIAACKAQGFPIAATEYAHECWCGNVLSRTVKAAEKDCNAPCGGDSSKICGGGNRLSVYIATNLESNEPCSNGNPPTSSSTSTGPTTQPTQSTSTGTSTEPTSTGPSTEPTQSTSTGPSTEPTSTGPSTEPTSTGPSTKPTQSTSTGTSTEPTSTGPSTEPTQSTSTGPSTEPTSTGPSTEPTSTGPSTKPTQSTSTGTSTEPTSTGPSTEPTQSTSTGPSTEPTSTGPSTKPTSTGPSTEPTQSTSTGPSTEPTGTSTQPTGPSTGPSTKPTSSGTSTQPTSSSTRPGTSTGPSTQPTGSSTRPGTTTGPTTNPGTTTKPGTSTKPTSTAPSSCTTTIVTPPTCEHQIGKWCLPPTPEWTCKEDCYAAWKKCEVTVYSCFNQAGYPDSLNCYEYASWCKSLKGYCGRCDNSSKCNKLDCWKSLEPGHVGTSTTKTVTTACTGVPTSNPPGTTTKPTTSSKPATTTKTSTSTTQCPPQPTNICKQPTDKACDFGPGNPVGGVPLPIVTCNDCKDDFNANPWKMYTVANSRNCPSYPHGRIGGVCCEACKYQYQKCVEVYANSCYNLQNQPNFHPPRSIEERQSWSSSSSSSSSSSGWGAGSSSSSSSSGSSSSSSSSSASGWPGWGNPGVCKGWGSYSGGVGASASAYAGGSGAWASANAWAGAGWGSGNNNYNNAVYRCKVQYDDCIYENQYINPVSECRSWGCK